MHIRDRFKSCLVYWRSELMSVGRCKVFMAEVGPTPWPCRAVHVGKCLELLDLQRTGVEIYMICTVCSFVASARQLFAYLVAATGGRGSARGEPSQSRDNRFGKPPL